MKLTFKKISIIFFGLFVLHLSVFALNHYSSLNPLETVRTLVSKTVQQIKTIKSQGDFNHQSLREFIKDEAIERFDMRLITQTLMGEYYQRATKNQQDAFRDAFSDRLLQIYSNSLKDFDNQKVLFKRDYQTLNNGRALVRTLLVFENNNTRLPIEYYLRSATNLGWLIYDIHIDGMSILATYRPSFKAQFDSKSIDQVINELRSSNVYIDAANDKSHRTN